MKKEYTIPSMTVISMMHSQIVTVSTDEPELDWDESDGDGSDV